jgi:hypothetical protein
MITVLVQGYVWYVFPTNTFAVDDDKKPFKFWTESKKDEPFILSNMNDHKNGFLVVSKENKKPVVDEQYTVQPVLLKENVFLWKVRNLEFRLQKQEKDGFCVFCGIVA